MIKNLRENIIEFISDHERTENCHEFVRFVIDNEDLNLYFCNMPVMVLDLFNVVENNIETVAISVRTMKFSTLKEFKEYYDNNKKYKYFIIHKVFRTRINIDPINGQTYFNFIRFAEIKKNTYRLINIKCELNEI